MTRTAADITADIAEQEANRPTPETVAKHEHTTISSLWRAGRLEVHELQAAAEISMIHYAFSRALSPHALNMETTNGAGQFVDPISRMRAREADAYEKRYKPWAAGESLRDRQLTVDIVAEDMRLREVERKYKLRNGAAYDLLTASLTRYAHLAGWTHG